MEVYTSSLTSRSLKSELRPRSYSRSTERRPTRHVPSPRASSPRKVAGPSAKTSPSSNRRPQSRLKASMVETGILIRTLIFNKVDTRRPFRTCSLRIVIGFYHRRELGESTYSTFPARFRLDKHSGVIGCFAPPFPVPTIGGFGEDQTVPPDAACWNPSRARFASSCSKKGMSDVAYRDITCLGETSMNWICPPEDLVV